MNCRMILRIVVAGGLTLLAACGIGKPMAIPVSEKELGPEPGNPLYAGAAPEPGAFTGHSGEWVIYRQK